MISFTCLVASASVALSVSFRSQEWVAVSSALASTFSAPFITSSSTFFKSRSMAWTIFSFISLAMFSSCFFASSHTLAKNSSTCFWVDLASARPSLPASSSACLAWSSSVLAVFSASCACVTSGWPTAFAFCGTFSVNSFSFATASS